MARGYLYEISNNLDHYPLFSHNADSMYTYCGTEFEYIENVSKHDTLENQENLTELFKQYGFTISYQENKDTKYTKYTYVSATIAAKKNYFANRLRWLKEQIKDVTLKEFSNETTTVHHIQETIEDKYGNAVLLNDSFYSFDTFIRMMEPDVKYYLGNVYLMH